MEEQKVNFAAFNPLDYVSGVLALGGAVAGAATANVAAAAFPLFGAIGCHLYNRQQLMKQIADRMTLMTQNYETLIRNQNLHVVNNTEQIRLLQDSINARMDGLSDNHQKSVTTQGESLRKLQQNTDKLQINTQNIQEFGENLEKRHEELASVVGELRQIENYSQVLRSNPSAADAHYQRGLSHQRLGDQQGALEDFSAAIRADSGYVLAYHLRGVILSELGNRKGAVQDLRQAAKLYFDAGDIESYHKAKELGKQLYDLDVVAGQESPKGASEIGVSKALSVGGLFDLN